MTVPPRYVIDREVGYQWALVGHPIDRDEYIYARLAEAGVEWRWSIPAVTLMQAMALYPGEVVHVSVISPVWPVALRVSMGL